LRHSLVLDRPSLQQMGRTLVMRAALWFMTITVSYPQQGTNLHPAQGSGSYAPACWLNLCRAGGTARSPTRSNLGAYGTYSHARKTSMVDRRRRGCRPHRHGGGSVFIQRRQGDIA